MVMLKDTHPVEIFAVTAGFGFVSIHDFLLRTSPKREADETRRGFCPGGDVKFRKKWLINQTQTNPPLRLPPLSRNKVVFFSIAGRDLLKGNQLGFSAI